jgi:hypothetical protein
MKVSYRWISPASWNWRMTSRSRKRKQLETGIEIEKETEKETLAWFFKDNQADPLAFQHSVSLVTCAVCEQIALLWTRACRRHQLCIHCRHLTRVTVSAQGKYAEFCPRLGCRSPLDREHQALFYWWNTRALQRAWTQLREWFSYSRQQLLSSCLPTVLMPLILAYLPGFMEVSACVDCHQPLVIDLGALAHLCDKRPGRKQLICSSCSAEIAMVEDVDLMEEVSSRHWRTCHGDLSDDEPAMATSQMTNKTSNPVE